MWIKQAGVYSSHYEKTQKTCGSFSSGDVLTIQDNIYPGQTNDV